jgi:RNA polymerase primary sigma factor
MARTCQLRTDPAQAPLATYLRDINETPLLNADEERELAYRIQDGDCEARDHMARANLRLVVNIARAYIGKGLGLQDLIEEGNLGLLRALEGFDPSMNTRFSTYASCWIKQSIKRGLVNTGKTVRIPAYMVELLTKWRRATAKLQEDLDRPPTQEEVAANLNLSRRKFNLIKKCIYNSAPQTEYADTGWSLDEMLIDRHARASDADMFDSEDRRQVLDELERMDPRQAAVLRMRFGLDNDDPMTLKEIGERLGLTRERVRQIEKEALGKLSDTMQPQ